MEVRACVVMVNPAATQKIYDTVNLLSHRQHCLWMRVSARLLHSIRMSSSRSYSDAIAQLNSLQSNAAVIELIRKQGGKGGEQQVVESIEYLSRIGYKV